MHNNINWLYKTGWKEESRMGMELIGKCPNPFHDDKNPSFSINFETGYYNCYSCEIGGMSEVSFLMEIYKVTKEEAIKMINPDIKNSDYNRKKLLYSLNSRIQSYFHRLINFQEEAGMPHIMIQARKKVLIELSRRKKSPDLITKYEIGYSHPVLINRLYKEEDEDLLKQAKITGFVEDRLTIPIRMYGNIIGWSMRAMKGQKQKYLNMYDKNLFPSNSWLWGLDTKNKDVVVCEGVFDAIALKELGYNACATLGTAFSTDRIRLLKTFTNINLIFDSDKAGAHAIERFFFESRGILDASRIKVCRLPHGKDPDSAYELDVHYSIKRAVPIFIWLLDRFTKEEDLELLIIQIKKFKEKLKRLPDKDEKSILESVFDKRIQTVMFQGTMLQTIKRWFPDRFESFNEKDYEKMRQIASVMHSVYLGVLK